MVTGYVTAYEPIEVARGLALKPGEHTFAIHCHQTIGGQGIDLGIVDVLPEE